LNGVANGLEKTKNNVGVNGQAKSVGNSVRLTSIDNPIPENKEFGLVNSLQVFH
jgi:hypothetical protein